MTRVGCQEAPTPLMGVRLTHTCDSRLPPWQPSKVVDVLRSAPHASTRYTVLLPTHYLAGCILMGVEAWRFVIVAQGPTMQIHSTAS